MPTGLTRTAGWQIGVSRTVDYPPEMVWDLLTSPEGLDVWLGRGATPDPAPGSSWSAADGAHGEVRSHHREDRIRLTCRPAGWDHETTVQLVIRPASRGRTSVRFHQERLADAQERARQRSHWQQVMDRIEALLGRRDAQDEAGTTA